MQRPCFFVLFVALLVSFNCRFKVDLSHFIAIVLVSFWNFGLTLKFGWTGGGTNGVVPLKT